MEVMKCDVCGVIEGVRCEIMMKAERVDRIYHLCHEHWVEVYSRCLEDFLEQNEYKVNSYIKVNADKLIVDSIHRDKMDMVITDEGMADCSKFNPADVRILRSYDGDEYCE
jgi:hypothetical protein